MRHNTHYQNYVSHPWRQPVWRIRLLGAAHSRNASRRAILRNGGCVRQNLALHFRELWMRQGKLPSRANCATLLLQLLLP